MLLKFVDSLHFYEEKKNKIKKNSPEECCGSTFTGIGRFIGLVFHSMKSLVGWLCNADVVHGGGS